MQEIPIFPLNVVVFPGMPMPLHIFEERYKEMINICLEEERPFGIVLIEKGEAAGDPNVTPHLIGCTVKISQVQRLEDGRMFIMTFGQDRFRIHKLERSKHAYLVGQVEYLSLDNLVNNEVEKNQSLRMLLCDYLAILQEVGDIAFDISQLPADTESLVYVAATLLNIEIQKKQALLESNQLSKMLEYLLRVYQKELDLLKLMPKEDEHKFSVN